LEQASSTLDELHRELTWIGLENEAMVQQILGLATQAKTLLLRRQWVQMFCTISARTMLAARHLGVQGLSQPPAPEDDWAFLHFFSQHTDKLVEAAARFIELIDVECRELLGLTRTRIFSNLQRMFPDLDLLDVLQRKGGGTPPGTPDRDAITRAARMDASIQRLQAIYSRPGTSVAGRPESSSSEEETSSEESGDEEAVELGDGEAASPASSAELDDSDSS
jgi:hypothetical protein